VQDNRHESKDGERQNRERRDSSVQEGGSSRKRTVAGCVLLVLLALALRIGLAEKITTVFQPDEIFQSLEPAHRLAYGYGVITWEWIVSMRSWVVPFFLSVIMRMTAWMGAGSSGYLLGVTVALSVLSLTSIWFAYAWARRVSGPMAGWIAALACTLHFTLVYFSPRAFSEVIAAHVLLPGLYFGAFAEGKHEKGRLFLAGALCGLAVCLRLQLAPAVVVAIVYFCYSGSRNPDSHHLGWRQRWLPVLCGFVLPVLLFGLVDKVTWSYPWQSFVVYFVMNVVKGRASTYGTDPWYAYAEDLLRLLGPWLLFVWHGARRSPFLAVIVLVIVISHSFLAHKEIRFIYPVVPIALTLASIGFVEILSKSDWRFLPRLGSRAIFSTSVGVILISSFFSLYALRGKVKSMGAMRAMAALSRDENVCGVGLDNVPWWSTGGETYLHHNVALLDLDSPTRLEADSGDVNVLLAPEGIAGVPSGFALTECWNNVCVLKRPGGCAPAPPSDEVNTYMRQEAEDAESSAPPESKH
jgi:phosphatidylinositol glycan class B